MPYQVKTIRIDEETLAALNRARWGSESYHNWIRRQLGLKPRKKGFPRGKWTWRKGDGKATSKA